MIKTEFRYLDSFERTNIPLKDANWRKKQNFSCTDSPLKINLDLWILLSTIISGAFQPWYRKSWNIRIYSFASGQLKILKKLNNTCQRTYLPNIRSVVENFIFSIASLQTFVLLSIRGNPFLLKYQPSNGRLGVTKNAGNTGTKINHLK